MRELNAAVVSEAKASYYYYSNPSSLSVRELLALALEPSIRNDSISLVIDNIMRIGLSEAASMSEYELSTLVGLNEKQSYQVMAIFELARKFSTFRPQDLDLIVRPDNAAALLQDMQLLDKEHFVVLLLDTKNKVIGRETVSIGTLNSTLVHPREVFKPAIRRGAASILIAHNHPSGDPTPSPEDIEVTRRVVEAGTLIGIEVIDHIIIGFNRHSSFKILGHM